MDPENSALQFAEHITVGEVFKIPKAQCPHLFNGPNSPYLKKVK